MLIFQATRQENTISKDKFSANLRFAENFLTVSGEVYMETKYYLDYIVNKIHTTVAATTDSSGLPVTSAIDIMDYDDDGLYFLTAKGKGFYNRLKNSGYLSLTGLKGEDTMSSVAVSVCGKVKEIGKEYLDRLIRKNPYMNEIYPTEESKQALTVFKLYEGNGEWFDLSKKPMERASFCFGGGKIKNEGYFITDKCIGCKICYSKCPQKCINIDVKPVVINQNNCLHCGNCFENCPENAIEKKA